jgi:erythromycin esterase
MAKRGVIVRRLNAIAPRRYDAFLFIDETRGVDPLHMPVTLEGEVPETYPSGM